MVFLILLVINSYSVLLGRIARKAKMEALMAFSIPKSADTS